LGYLLPPVDRAVIEEIGIGIIAVDFEDFRNVAASRPPLDLNDDMERVGDVALDGSSVFFHDRCVATERTVNFEPLLFRA